MMPSHQKRFSHHQPQRINTGVSRTFTFRLIATLSWLSFSYLALSETAFAQLPDVASSGAPPETTLDSTPSGDKVLGQGCLQSMATSTDLTNLSNQVMEVANWVENPSTSLSTIIQTVGPQILARLAPSAWPTIHERARLARVPVIMYHDILPEKEVYFDTTVSEFEQHLQSIKENGLTPITMEQLLTHLRTGLPLPEKPIMLTFDDGYRGHYDYVFPLLKQYGYPAVFAIYTLKVGRDHGRPGLTWEQLREMAADPLVTIAAHSVTHADLRSLSGEELQREVVESKETLEQELGIPINYFAYPEGYYNDEVLKEVKQAGYLGALSMDKVEGSFAGASPDLLTITRFGYQRFDEMLTEAWGGPPMPTWSTAVDFKAPITLSKTAFDDTSLILISGGRPVTVHADSRYQVEDIVANTDIEAAVDGGFFSLEYLDSNTMIGPVFSRNNFVPGSNGDNVRMRGRPLVLISPNTASFIPFDPDKHNTLEGLQADMAGLTDAFVAGAWLVKEGQPQPYASFNGLFGFDALRHRSFWGLNQAGQPIIGVTTERVDSVRLGVILAEAGIREAVMLDSGASSALVYKGESVVGFVPRPVPHVVGLVPLQSEFSTTCTIASR